MTVNIEYHIDEIASIVGGEFLLKSDNTGIDFLSVDSRRVNNPNATLFWAIRTGQRDGSNFIPELYKKGVRNFVTQTEVDSEKLKGANVLLVRDSVAALQQLAIHHRKRFKKLKVIGITGSNGKTVVKDWLYSLLAPYYNVVKSPRSFNSQIGVPLSILQIRSFHEYGIFEAGISQPGEMKKLERMIRPQTGIFTNMGPAHDEGFTSREEKVKEKLLLFSHVDQLIFPKEEKLIEEGVEANGFDKRISINNWGKADALFILQSVKTKRGVTEIVISSDNKIGQFKIQFTDKGSIQNAINCYCAIESLGIGNGELLKGFERLQPLSMRLELQQGINGCRIINDSYSNDLQSLEVAMDFLVRQQAVSYTLILSDVLQAGQESDTLYKEIAEMVLRKGIKRMIGIGENISRSAIAFKKIPQHFFFPDTESLLAHLDSFAFKDEVILIKGARKFAFERISRRLERQSHETVFSINLTNLAHNIRVYKSLLKPGTKMMAMVKAFAYGAGSSEISSLLQFIKSDYLAVAYADEGVALREAGITLPVMVMNVSEHSFDTLVKYQLEPEIFSVSLLNSFVNYLSGKKIKNYPVHLKVDTGMHRLGFVLPQVDELLKVLQHNKLIRVASVFSHLSSSDNPAHDAFTMQQYRHFLEAVKKIRTVIKYPFLRHIANTSAISRFPALQLDMVRLGIGMYGIDGNAEVAMQLKPVCKLTTTISQIKKVDKGEVVGYGRNRIRKNKLIATVGIGYADGFSRLLGNGTGTMYAGEKQVPTVGNICMDMTMIDISNTEGVKEGDCVEVFGENISLNEVAEKCQTIPYEILTGISQRVKRIYFEE